MCAPIVWGCSRRIRWAVKACGILLPVSQPQHGAWRVWMFKEMLRLEVEFVLNFMKQKHCSQKFYLKWMCTFKYGQLILNKMQGTLKRWTNVWMKRNSQGHRKEKLEYEITFYINMSLFPCCRTWVPSDGPCQRLVQSYFKCQFQMWWIIFPNVKTNQAHFFVAFFSFFLLPFFLPSFLRIIVCPYLSFFSNCSFTFSFHCSILPSFPFLFSHLFSTLCFPFSSLSL